MYPWAIYQHGSLRYIGLHASEDDCWQVYLGWPSYEEILDAKHKGKTCEQVAVIRATAVEAFNPQSGERGEI